MKLHNRTADVFVPDGKPAKDALKRITHLGIGAHQDDLEFMAYHGIVQCYRAAKQWFGGITCTNGGGSARTGVYANYTDNQMQMVRREEQRAAAVVGCYGAMVQLDYPSSEVKNPSNTSLKADLKQLLAATSASTVYTHNPADKHDTHIGVVVATLQAIRELPRGRRPQKVYGCEVWRSLDWMPDSDKAALEVGAHANLAAALNGIFDSQIAGGKRYDLAVLGRRRANATFFESHATDEIDHLWFAMDLSPLVADESLDVVEYVCGFIDTFKADVVRKLSTRLGRAK